MRELVGVLHVHTSFSDGSAGPAEVIDAAAGCGLDFLGINDHMSLAARESGFAGRLGGLVVLAGAEVHDGRGRHHLLAYGIDSLPRSPDTAGQIEEINAAGGLAIAAHPCERRGYLPMTHAIGWSARRWPGLGGVEVWNYMSQWKAGLSILNLGRRLADPDDLVRKPSEETIGFWRLQGGCPVAGADAHAWRIGAGRRARSAFPYDMLFRRIRMHVFVEDRADESGGTGEKAVIEALRAGRCFVSNALLGNAGGFEAVLSGGGLELYLPGAGDVVLHSASGFRRLRSEGGRAALDVSGDDPFAVSVEKDGRTWIWSALYC
jgi:hypothetical protein